MPGLFKEKTCNAVRCPVLYVSLVYHDSAVVFEYKSTHFVRESFVEDLECKKIRQVLGLKVLDQLLEERRIDATEIDNWSIAILVRLHLAAGNQTENVAMDLLEFKGVVQHPRTDLRAAPSMTLPSLSLQCPLIRCIPNLSWTVKRLKRLASS